MALQSLLETLHNRLRLSADASKAPAMQAYMKSDMPCLGVSAVPLREICKQVFGKKIYPSTETWQRDVLALWRGARFREERYAAIELTGIRGVQAFQTMRALPMYEEIIVTGAWWDYVDAIATQRLILLLGGSPTKMKRKMLSWSKSGDMWKRRSAII